MAEYSWIKVATLSAALAVAGCSESNQTARAPSADFSAPAAPPQAKPVAAPPTTAAAADLATARQAFRKGQYKNVLTTLADADSTEARLLKALSQVELSRGDASATSLVASASATAADLTKHEETSSLGRLLQLYVENPALRTTANIDLLSNAGPPEEVDLALAKFYSVTGDADRALAYAERAYSHQPRDPRLFESMFMASLAAKNWSAARRYVDTAIALKIGGEDGANWQLALNRARGDLVASQFDLEELTKKNPKSPALWTALADAYFQGRNYSSSRTAIARAVELSPNMLSLHKMLLLADMRLPGSEAALYIRSDLASARSLAPSDADIERFADVIESPQEVIKRRTTRLDENPADVPNRLSLARAYMQVREPENALEIFRPAYEANPQNPEVAAVYANILNNAKRFDDAVTVLRPLTDSGPAVSRTQALISIGLLYQSNNRMDDAITSYKQALEWDKSNIEARKRLADLYFDMTRLDDAAAMYGEIVALHPEEAAVARRQIESLLRAGRTQQAMPLLNDFLSKNPRDVQALTLKAFSLINDDKPDEAMSCLNRVLEIDSRNVQGLYYQAMVFYKYKKDAPHAVADLTAALREDPSSFNVALLLSQIYEDAGALEQAKSVLMIVMNRRPAGDPGGDAVRRKYEELQRRTESMLPRQPA